MKRVIAALAAGAIFGAGLALSGMADPQRVRAFLDIFGAWDPTLAFVMGGALAPMAIAWAIQRRMARPILAGVFDLPPTRGIDRPLAVGAVIFGVGWGISGLCPGPAIAGLALAPSHAIVAVAAMGAGMALHRLTSR
ncbi:putative transporter component [Sphingopyxis fribergensis]|uniref:Putative transporter component n=1 Tax=Sphingopyxis fribergensis TaxID=1515612 RepID=A0A0A7PMH2_9SPHN|nr:DUF6691 family protein [Sphingopyxis fribergensis]AJA09122.1 putative transporter component [Sphingopyxis fribergensis]